jgi:hypothetical protein
MHVSHAVEELVELILAKRRAKSRDPASDLASRGSYLFSSSLVVHRAVGGI